MHDRWLGRKCAQLQRASAAGLISSSKNFWVRCHRHNPTSSSRRPDSLEAIFSAWQMSRDRRYNTDDRLRDPASWQVHATVPQSFSHGCSWNWPIAAFIIFQWSQVKFQWRFSLEKESVCPSSVCHRDEMMHFFPNFRREIEPWNSFYWNRSRAGGRGRGSGKLGWKMKDKGRSRSDKETNGLKQRPDERGPES